MWDLLRPGIKLLSPALQLKFLTLDHQGGPKVVFDWLNFLIAIVK